VSTRTATEQDIPAVEELWQAFAAELPAAEYLDVDPERVRARIVGDGLSFVATTEDERTVVGFALARRAGSRLVRLTDLYVTPERRRQGVATRLLRALREAAAADGAEALDLEVQVTNDAARAAYARLGFREELLTLVAPLQELERRLGDGNSDAPSFGSIHVQTDDVAAIVRAVEIYVPRLRGRSRGSVVSQPRGGYVTVYDDACDRDPAMLRRLAREISTRTGLATIVLGLELEALVRLIVFDRGAIVDEYVSVPEYYGALPPGEIVALQANPVVIERVTGASREAIRAATPVASALHELPPPRELLAQLTEALGLVDAGHGWDGAAALPGATRIDR
jgi:ribosomal protein S18 acetylase RimI-like enzyme